MVQAMPPDELAAIGQILGAGFTLLAVVVALWIALSDNRRRDREARDQLAAQARTVTATVEEAGEATPFGRRTYMAVVVENHGSRPVTRVIVRGVRATVEGVEMSKWHIADHADSPDNNDGQGPVNLCNVLGPSATFRSPQVFIWRDGVRPTEHQNFEPWTTHVDIGFVDADGIAWFRDGNGRPRRWLNAFDVMEAAYRSPDPEA